MNSEKCKGSNAVTSTISALYFTIQVWLIEINVNPSLSINCDALKECIPPMVKEAICEYQQIDITFITISTL